MSSKEQFSTLISKSQGTALEKVIEQILTSQLINTSSFLNEPNIKKLGDKNKHYQTLHLFSYGTWKDYVKSQSKYISLTEPQSTKLKLLTLLELAKTHKQLSYSELKPLLDITSSFQLEQILFNAFNKGYLTGSINSETELVKIITVCPRNNLKGTSSSKAQIDKWITNLEETEKYINKRCKEMPK